MAMRLKHTLTTVYNCCLAGIRSAGADSKVRCYVISKNYRRVGCSKRVGKVCRPCIGMLPGRISVGSTRSSRSGGARSGA